MRDFLHIFMGCYRKLRIINPHIKYKYKHPTLVLASKASNRRRCSFPGIAKYCAVHRGYEHLFMRGAYSCGVCTGMKDVAVVFQGIQNFKSCNCD